MKKTTRDLLLEVRRLSQAAHDAQADLLAQAGFGALERQLLDVLAATGRPRTIEQLARSTLRARSAIESSVHGLQERGWVGERHDGKPPDASYALTTAGHTARCAVRQAELRLEAIVAASLDDDGPGRAIDVLRKARRRLEFAHQPPRPSRTASAVPGGAAAAAAVTTPNRRASSPRGEALLATALR